MERKNTGRFLTTCLKELVGKGQLCPYFLVFFSIFKKKNSFWPTFFNGLVITSVKTPCLGAKAQQWMYFLKKLLTWTTKCPTTFCWFENASEAQKKIIRKPVTTASKVLGSILQSSDYVYRDHVMNKASTAGRDERTSIFTPTYVFKEQLQTECFI